MRNAGSFPKVASGRTAGEGRGRRFFLSGGTARFQRRATQTGESGDVMTSFVEVW